MDHYSIKFREEEISKKDEKPVEHQNWLLHISSNHIAYVYQGNKFLFPVIYKNRWFYREIFRPAFVQKYFSSKNEINEKLIQNIIAEFPCGHLQLNVRHESFNWKIEERVNYILPLQSEYGILQNNFSEHHRRNINKAKGSDLNLYIVDIWKKEFLDFVMKNHKPIDNKFYFNTERIRQFVEGALKEQLAKIYIIKDHEDHLLLVAVFLQNGERLMYSLGVSNKEGYEKRAMYLLFSEVIKSYAGSKVILDFEGSSIKGIANFFKGFGAMPEYYYSYTWRNHLFCKWMHALKNILKR